MRVEEKFLRNCIICEEAEVSTEGIRIGDRDSGGYIYLCGSCCFSKDTRLWVFRHLDELLERDQIAVTA